MSLDIINAFEFQEISDSNSNTLPVDKSRNPPENNRFSAQENKLIKSNGRRPGDHEHKKNSNVFHHQPYKKQVCKTIIVAL